MWKYVSFLIGVHILGRLPLPLLYRLVSALANLGYLLLPRQRANVCDNMRHALGPRARKGEVRKAARQVFRNVAKYYADLVHMRRLDFDDFFQRRLRHSGFEENFLPAYQAGKGVILVSAHFGNPELAIQALLQPGIKAFALTEPLQPPRLSRLVDGLRSTLGHTFRPVSVTNVKMAFRTLKAGGVVALMLDRDIEGPRVRLPFCGEETLLPTGPVEMAMRTGAALVPTFCARGEADKIEVVFEEPLEMVDTGGLQADVRTNALRLLAHFERHLRRDPGQWMVLERVWEGGADAVPETLAAGGARR
ncbi:MAG: lysophospholipid acyltransferase family protein [Dehalococcoidia bacterium]